MASSSASTSYSSYDIFINHRGPDVKMKFASYLYRRLISKGESVFLDKEELEEGQNVSCQIQEAIRGASIHIAIFSPTYADSRWCLDELVLMKNSGATILPIFFEVQPSVVCHTVQHGAYAESLRKLQEKTTQSHEIGEEKPRYSCDTIQGWRDALSYVGQLKGFVHGGEDDEGELLDKVVQKVLHLLPKTQLDVARYPTGVDEKLQDFENTVFSLQQDENRVKAKVVGIVGQGGVGKTTLAKKFFNLRRSAYSSSSFLFDVRENAHKGSVNHLQSKLIKDLKGEDIRIDSPDEGKGILKKHLSSCHALIILDDIDHVSQLEALLPKIDILAPGSLILATSRDKHILRSSGMFLDSSIYYLKRLNKPHSEQLFCSYAFTQPLPPPEFADLAVRFVIACDGLPLSLKVLGALVCGQDESYWEEILNELGEQLPSEIQETLKISYESLSLKDKQVFLDIACFFLAVKRDLAIGIWGAVGIQNLEDKCLLEVEDGKIKMHDHIRDMGRIFSKEEISHRLWDQTTNDIDALLEHWSSVKTEIQVRGIKMRSPEMPSHFVFGNSPMQLVNDSRCGGILNLRFLETKDGDFLERILKQARSPHLQCLSCYDYPYPCLPPLIPLQNLIVLDVTGSRLETLWYESQARPLQLRELRICASTFSNIPKSIGQLKYLVSIEVTSSSGRPVALKSLPEEFCDLRSLKYLTLTYCGGLTSLPDSFGRLTNLQRISFKDAYSLKTLPESFGNLSRLKVLELEDCRGLTISSSTLGNITTLEHIDLTRCRNVRELPSQVAHQRSLQDLDLIGANLKELPSWIGDLSNLNSLSLGSDLLEVLPPFLSNLKSLKYLWLSAAPRLTQLPDHIVQLTQLRSLSICDCGIVCLPQDLAKMNNLETLVLNSCPLREPPFKKFESEERGRPLNKLESVHDNDNCMYGLQYLRLAYARISELIFWEGLCPNLRNLDLRLCGSLTQIEGIEMLISLEVLCVGGCRRLKSIPGLGQLKKLRRLDARACSEMVELSGAEHLMLLQELEADRCPKLQWGVGVVEQLRQRLKEGLKL